MNAKEKSSIVEGSDERRDRDKGKFHNLISNTLKYETTEKQNATWTVSATTLLLKLYESELQSLETTKKKKKIWHAISDNLKNYNIDVTLDQVRWKINALTKKYKKCLESGSNCKFKYFRMMEQIHAKHTINIDTYTISDLLDSKTDVLKYVPRTKTENKAIIELRKMRLANRLESDRAQTKIQIERQWLEYLNRQEQSRLQRDQFNEKYINIKEQELEMRKKYLEFEQSIEIKNMQLIEKDLSDFLQTKREMCDLLKFSNL